jgi:hypothetical protein
LVGDGLWDGLGLCDGVGLCVGVGLDELLELPDGLGLCVGLGLVVGVGLCDGVGLDEWLGLVVGLVVGLGLAVPLRVWDAVVLVNRVACTLAVAAPHRPCEPPACAVMTGPNVTPPSMRQPTAALAVIRAACAMLAGTRITPMLTWQEPVPGPCSS